MLRLPAASVRLSLLIAVALPASASAAPLVELPFQRRQAGTGCQAPTGSPGELSRWAEGGAAVLSAGPGGLGRPAVVALGELPGCPRVAANAVLARPSPRGRRRTHSGWRCASRAAGASARRSPSPRRATSSTSASPSSSRTGTRWWRGRSGRRGACAFRWRGARPAARSARRWSSCRGVGPVAVRCSSGWRRTAKASWSSASRWAPRSARRASTPCASARAEHHWARPGFAARALHPRARRCAERTRRAGSDVFERFGGRDRAACGWRPRRATAAHRSPRVAADAADEMSIAFGTDDRTVLVWHDRGYQTTGAAIRDGATGFGPPVVIVPPPKQRGFGRAGAGLPIIPPLPALQSAVAPDGRVSVAWPDGDLRLATIAGNTVVERQRLGSPLRVPDGLSLLTLADGRRAVAWSNQDRWFDHTPPARVHYAIEGAPRTPERAAPRVTVGPPRERALRPGQSLALPIRCTAACGPQGHAHGRRRWVGRRALAHSRRHRHRAARPAGQTPIAPARPGPVRIVVQSSAPGARTVTRTIARPRLRRGCRRCRCRGSRPCAREGSAAAASKSAGG